MAGHQHKEHSGSELERAARAALTDAGEQWTQMRATVFAELAARDTPASAYDIADSVSSARGRRVAANSIYRILDLFVRANLASRIESANAYLVNRHPGCRHDCIFLICDRCGTADHLDDAQLTNGLRDAARASGFEDIRTVVELRGLCVACRSRPD